MPDLLEVHRKVVRGTKVNPAIGFGSAVAGAFALFGIAGWRADLHFGTGHLWTLVGVGVAFFYTFYELWKLIRRSQQDEADAAAAKSDRKPAKPD
jgi:4-hydroxybenzoate polyprenyltransferase